MYASKGKILGAIQNLENLCLEVYIALINKPISTSYFRSLYCIKWNDGTVTTHSFYTLSMS